MADLQPPRIVTEDPGAHDVSESSDEHFSSASEGGSTTGRPSIDAAPQSPIPITRVERVDDAPAHGEVPGTQAYNLRTQDAVPDEIEIVPEGQRSRSGTQSRSRAASVMSAVDRPSTPGGSPIPRTVVDRVDDKPAHGEVEGTLAHEIRQADAEPDEVRIHAGETGSSQGREVAQTPGEQQAWFRSMWEGKQGHEDGTRQENVDEDNDEDFGDDFDEFAEGDEDDDFGDFDEGGDDATPTTEPEPQPQAQPQATTLLDSFPLLDLKSDGPPEDFDTTMLPYLDAIFPGTTDATQVAQRDWSQSSPFLSERSLSLWQQLVQPPPMQPPNWTRSRIRRLFLVSLGVPVDLDEILPPSKQKRLILPNINLTSPRASTAALERLRSADANDSTTSLDSRTGAPKPKLKRTNTAPRGPPPPPDFDANGAALICGTTEEAINGFEDIELKDHVFTLEILNQRASAVLEYWLQQKDDGLKEKEALEGVIENLVGFVKGRRGK